MAQGDGQGVGQILRSLKPGRAKLPLDRFICLAARDAPAVVVTRPFKLHGHALEVNVDAGAGRAQVEILDEAGKPIPGFSGQDAPTRRAVDELRLRPQWKNNRDLSAVKGRVIRIRFSLRNARLYAFQVR